MGALRCLPACLLPACCLPASPFTAASSAALRTCLPTPTQAQPFVQPYSFKLKVSAFPLPLCCAEEAGVGSRGRLALEVASVLPVMMGAAFTQNNFNSAVS